MAVHAVCETTNLRAVHYAERIWDGVCEDDIDNGIVGGLIPIVEDPNPSDTGIVGNSFIKVKGTYDFEFTGDSVGSWFIHEKYPVRFTVDADNPKKISLAWIAPYSGQFELSYGDYKKTIVVESLF